MAATTHKYKTPNPELFMVLDRLQASIKNEERRARNHRVKSLVANLDRWEKEKRVYLYQVEMAL